MVKNFFLGLTALTAAATATALFSTRDTPPTHPVLQASTLPPLIPTRAFWANANDT